MTVKAQLMDEPAMMRSLARMTHEIIERNHGFDDVLLVGIKRRGAPLAEILSKNILRFEGVSVPVGYVDISMYRDDLTVIDPNPVASGHYFPCDIEGKTVVLVDDVIYTGRTARAAIEALFREGRPGCVQLAVLVDRGHRELPVKPDFVGKNVPTFRGEVVRVNVEEYDGEYSVTLGNP